MPFCVLTVCAFLTKEDAITLPVLAVAWLIARRRPTIAATVCAAGLIGLAVNLRWLVHYLRMASINPELAIAGFSGGLPLSQHIPTAMTSLVS